MSTSLTGLGNHEAAASAAYNTLAEIGYACDFSPEAEANAVDFRRVQADVERLIGAGYVDRTSTIAGSTVLAVTLEGWGVLAAGGYRPPWDDALDAYEAAPSFYGRGTSL